MTPLRRQIVDLLSPLADFYSSHGTEPPRITALEGTALPAPYRSLLVHDQDMTSTLEKYFGASLQVKVLEKEVGRSLLTRQVILVTEPAKVVAEFGAIRIHLDCFSPEPRADIVACQLPLGTILKRHRMSYSCRPNAYFSFESDEIAKRAFGLDSAHILYGRHNVLVDGSEQTLAEVVEFFPPRPWTLTP